MAAPAFNLIGKIALICGGGGGGIGTATSRMVAESGADLFVVDRTDELLEETKAIVTGLGRKCGTLKVDLRDKTQVKTIVPAVKREFGGLDLIANIAGGMQRGQWQGIDAISDESYSEIMALNIDYVFQVCRDAGKLMLTQGRGGSIVNIASGSAWASAPYHGPYGAAKRAVTALTQTMAVEWGPYGIRCNTVAPGSTRTARASRGAGGPTLDARAKNWAPLAKPVEKEDVAAAILFFMSDLAKGITGQLLNVDCGVTARCVIAPAEQFKSYVK